MVIIPTFTLTVPNNGPLIINFDKPLMAIGGLDIITAGTPGVVDLWIDADVAES